MTLFGGYRRKKARRNPGTKKSSSKLLPVLLILLALCLGVAGGTLAFVAASSDPVENGFEPAQMRCAVQEDFTDGITKKNVCVQNTGDAPAYIRVKLVPYWYDKEEDVVVAKSAWTPDFTPGNGWVLGADGYYYYKAPVDPGDSTGVLIPAVTLKQDEVSLARQVLEIIASCVQAEPADAVEAAWAAPNGSVTGVTGGQLTVRGG